MSFMDKAKQKIKGVPKILGEETVRVVNYSDDDSESHVEREPASAPASKLKSAFKDKLPTPQKSDSNSDGSVFNIEEKVTFFGKKKKPDAIDKAAEELVKVDQNKIKDVLEILEIPATFEIDSDTFLPEDITEIEFDYQTPHGYDMGQVGAFVEQARDSVSSYVQLLRLRNEHIAKLATVVDRLQVDLNNQRFDSEIANGINIMPTQDDDDLNNQNMELKLLVMRLREELAALQSGDNLSTVERQTFDDLQDQLSIVTRENETLKEENYGLKTQLSYLDEDMGVDPVENEKAYAPENLDLELPTNSGLLTFENDNSLVELSDDGLPDFSSQFADDENEQDFTSAFHNGEELTLDEFILENQSNSDEDSEEDDGDFSMIEIMGEAPAPAPAPVKTEVKSNPRSISIFDEDEDDELDAIMKQEFGEN
jgi:cell division septum initiation protein DivIVA